MKNLTLIAWLTAAVSMTALFGACKPKPEGSVGEQVSGSGGSTDSSGGASGSSDNGGSGGSGQGGIIGTVAIKFDGAFVAEAENYEVGLAAPPTADAHCGGATPNSTTRLPADVLLVLDRSGSMTSSTESDSMVCRTGDPNCIARWPALVSSVTSTMHATQGTINWGLKLFPSPNSFDCEVNPGVDVFIDQSSVPRIEELMSSNGPGGSTPTATAIQAATDYLKAIQDVNGSGKYILLATDGQPNCGGDMPGTVEAITAARLAGYLTFVIGIGPSVTNLDMLAQAGGTERSFPATSPDALAQAFSTISKAVTSCTFESTTEPLDPNNVAVYEDGKLVKKDPANGWSFGKSKKTFILNGSACTLIQSGAATKVQILFGCAGVAPPPTVPIL